MSVTDHIKRNVLTDICKHVYAFEGEIYGSFIRDFRIINQDVIKMHIRINPWCVIPFINILSIKYRIIPDETCVNNPCYDVYYNSTLCTTLDILAIKVFDFRCTPCNFDCNLLAENGNGLFIWRCYPALRTIVDKFSFILERINQRKFCLLHRGPCDTNHKVADVVNYAYNMTKNGWNMDDVIIGRLSWLICKWQDMPPVRTCCKECAICQEEFQSGDVVLNTLCNHNFHWFCRNNTSDKTIGLFNWVNCEQQVTCPSCRSIMF